MAAVEQEAPQYLQGEVMHVVDPSDFWMRVGTEETFKQFEEFERQLNLHCQQQSIGTTEHVSEYSIVLVNCTNKDGKIGSQWRRATVHRINREKGTYDVFYQDYGNNENVPAKRICEFVSPDIQQFPAQCHKYALAGIKPIASSWTSRGVKLFTKLATSGRLFVVFLFFDHPTMCYRVALYPSGDKGRSLTHEMLDQFFGEKTEEEVPEFLTGYSAEACDYDQSEYTGYFTGQEQSLEYGTYSDDLGGGDMYSTDTYTIKDTSKPYSEMAPHGLTMNGRHSSSEPSQDALSTPMATGSLQQGDRLTPGSASVVVPRFNLSMLQQRRMLSAEELQKEAEAAAQAERKARLQQDIIECHRDLVLEGFPVDGGVDKWGKPSVERQNSSGSDGDVYDRISAQIRTATADDDQNFVSFEQALFRDVSPAGPNTEDPGKKQTDLEVRDTPGATVTSAKDAQTSGEESPEDPGSSEASGDRKGFPPERQTPSPTADEIYDLVKKFRSILYELNQGEDLEFVCAQFHSLVPVERHEDSIKYLVPLLLEEGVKNPDLMPAAQDILDTYSIALEEAELTECLRSCCDKFVKLPVGKMPSYHTNFAHLLVKLLQKSAKWRVELQTSLQDFIMHCVEKWIIFNKRGTQSGAIHQRLERIYLDCVQVILPPCITTLGQWNTEAVHFIFSEMKSKILETDVDYSIRSQLLDLLQWFKFSTGDENEGEVVIPPIRLKLSTVNQYTQTEVEEVTVEVKKKDDDSVTSSPKSAVACKNKAMQTEKHSKSSESSKKRTAVVTKHAESQTDPWESSTESTETGAKEQRTFEDAEVQTEMPEFTSQLSNSSASSNGSVPALDRPMEAGGTPAPGRARRRRVLTQHLQDRGETGEHDFDGDSMASASSSLGHSQSSARSSAADDESTGDREMVSAQVPISQNLVLSLSGNTAVIEERGDSLVVLVGGDESAIDEEKLMPSVDMAQSVYLVDNEPLMSSAVDAEQLMSSVDAYDSNFPTLGVDQPANPDKEGLSVDTNREGLSLPLIGRLSLQSIASGILGWRKDETHQDASKTNAKYTATDSEKSGCVNASNAQPSQFSSSSPKLPSTQLSGGQYRARSVNQPSNGETENDTDTSFHSSVDAFASQAKDASFHSSSSVDTGGSKDNSVDHPTPDDWEMRLTPEEESLGPAGDAPLSMGETSSGSVYTDCRQELNRSSSGSAGLDTEGVGDTDWRGDGWDREDTPQPADSEPACQYKTDIYGFEVDSDLSGDSFLFESDPEEPITGEADTELSWRQGSQADTEHSWRRQSPDDAQYSWRKSSDARAESSWRKGSRADADYNWRKGSPPDKEPSWRQFSPVKGSGSCWQKGSPSRQNERYHQNLTTLPSTQRHPVGDAEMTEGWSEEFQDGLKERSPPPQFHMTSSPAELGVLPGEKICTMPRVTSHIKDKNKQAESLHLSDTALESGKSSSSSQCSGVGYERGDLAKEERPKPKSGKGKTKFRPLPSQYLQPSQPVQPAEGPKKPWVPSTRCTKCGQEGHLRYDCTQTGSKFFYD